MPEEEPVPVEQPAPELDDNPDTNVRWPTHP